MAMAIGYMWMGTVNHPLLFFGLKIVVWFGFLPTKYIFVLG